MLQYAQTFTKSRDFWWRLFPFVVGIALSRGLPIVDAKPVSEVQPIQTNSNQASGGILAAGVLTMNLEVCEGEWFPEDEHGPSVKVFALAEKGKPAQIPGPMIRVRQGTVIHLQVQNLISVVVVMHGMHSRPRKEDDVLEIPAGASREVSFTAENPAPTTTGRAREEKLSMVGRTTKIAN